jgi:hypothetical protein
MTPAVNELLLLQQPLDISGVVRFYLKNSDSSRRIHGRRDFESLVVVIKNRL